MNSFDLQCEFAPTIENASAEHVLQGLHALGLQPEDPDDISVSLFLNVVASDDPMTSMQVSCLDDSQYEVEVQFGSLKERFVRKEATSLRETRSILMDYINQTFKFEQEKWNRLDLSHLENESN